MKRQAALLLCLVMLLSLFPAGEHAHAHFMYGEQVSVGLQPSSCGHGGTFDVKLSFYSADPYMDYDISNVTITSDAIEPWSIEPDTSVRILHDQSLMLTFTGVHLKSDASANGDSTTITFSAREWWVDWLTHERTGGYHDFTLTTTLTITHSYAVRSDGAFTHSMVCVCGRVDSTENHTWNSGEQVTAPSCILPGTNGSMLYTCTVCGATKTEAIPWAHSWGAWRANGDGLHVRECSVCGTQDWGNCADSYSDVISPPTCEAAGNTTRTCTVCGYQIFTDYTNPLGHLWGSWLSNGDGTHTRTCANDAAHTETAPCAYTSVITPPTCVAAGYTTHTCTAVTCGYSYTDRPVGDIGHDWGSWLSNGDGTHTRTCANDAAHIETSPCAYSSVVTPPTCEAAGFTTHTCTACGHSFTDTSVAATGHNTVTDSAVPPTCTLTGLTEGSHCSVCREVLVAQQTVAAMGHTPVTDSAVLPTCTLTGLTEGSHCSVCSEALVVQQTVAATGHDWGPWTLNGDGTHSRACLNDPAHTQTLDFGLHTVQILKVETLGASTLKVFWNGSPEADGYEVWYGTAAAGPYMMAKVTGDTAYSKTYLQPGVRYFFKVRAYIMENGVRVCGAFSISEAGVPLAKSVITSTSSVNTSQIKLTWEKVAGATSYEVFRSKSKTGPYSAIRKINALSMTVTGMEPGNTYYFKVRACKKIYTANYYGPISEYRTGRTLVK